MLKIDKNPRRPLPATGKDFEFTGDRDLSQAQIDATHLSYYLFADTYIRLFERTDSGLFKAMEDTIIPFTELIGRELASQKKILFAGSGSGRDMEQFQKMGFKVFGIDTSSTMLDFSRAIIQENTGLSPMLALMSIEMMGFGEESFDGIFCESALSHVRKKDIPSVLDQCQHFLKKDGVALFGFRESDSGEVYRTQDPVGIRYNTSHTKEEVVTYFDNSDFDIVHMKTVDHPVKLRPKYLNIFARKR